MTVAYVLGIAAVLVAAWACSYALFVIAAQELTR